MPDVINVLEHAAMTDASRKLSSTLTYLSHTVPTCTDLYLPTRRASNVQEVQWGYAVDLVYTRGAYAWDEDGLACQRCY